MLDKIVIYPRNPHLLKNRRAGAFIFYRKSELKSRGHKVGEYRAIVNGEEWVTWGSEVFLDNTTTFLGMKPWLFGFYTSPEFEKEYRDKYGEGPSGIWSYDVNFGGDPVRGSFISLNELRKMAQDYIDECVKLGLYEKEK